MAYQEQVWQWEHTVSSHLPLLRKPQARVLASWSCAAVLLKSVGMTQVSVWLGLLWGGKMWAWRQKLRVLVMADRGLSSRDLSQAICQQGWHPY
jgi:hypothetical protein